jgi:hypothetical protein
VPKKLEGDGRYSTGGFEERLGLPADFKPPALPVSPKSRDFDRRKRGTRETGFLVKGDGTVDSHSLAAMPAESGVREHVGSRLDGLVALVFPDGCNVWTNFDYQQRKPTAEGSISLLIKDDDVVVLRGVRSTPTRRHTQYFGGQILFSFARAGIESPQDVATAMAGMLERSATFASELVRYTTADPKQRVRADAIVTSMDVDYGRTGGSTRDLCCVFAYTLRDNHVFKAAMARRIFLKFIMSGDLVEQGFKRTPVPPPLTVKRIIPPETFGCLAYTEADADHVIARLSIFPDVLSLREIEHNRRLFDDRGQPLSDRLHGPQGEVLLLSTPGMDRYLG